MTKKRIFWIIFLLCVGLLSLPMVHGARQKRMEQALFTAIEKNRPEEAAALLKSGVNPNAYMKTELGARSALMHACLLGRNNIVILLLDNGAAINGQSLGKARNAWTNNVPDFLHGLMVRIFPEPLTRKGQTPIMYAAAGDHPDLIRLLYDRGADLHAKDIDGNTAESFARSPLTTAAIMKLEIEESWSTTF